MEIMDRSLKDVIELVGACSALKRENDRLRQELARFKDMEKLIEWGRHELYERVRSLSAGPEVGFDGEAFSVAFDEFADAKFSRYIVPDRFSVDEARAIVMPLIADEYDAACVAARNEWKTGHGE